jgi:hypothetical protein
MHVDQLSVDQADSAGAVVRTIYAKQPPEFAVYRTDERVMIHYADDPAKQDP